MIKWEQYIEKKPSPKTEAKKLSTYGRNGDSILMHITPLELELAKATGGVTTNPDTGLPEGFLLLGSLLAGLASAAAAAAPVAGAIGTGISAIGSALSPMFGIGAGGFGSSLAGLTAAAAPGAGVLSGAGAGVLAPTTAALAPTVGGSALGAGIGSVSVPTLGYTAPSIASANLGMSPALSIPQAMGTAGFATPASALGTVAIPEGLPAATASANSGSALSSIGKGASAIGNYAAAHPTQSLMALYGIGTLADRAISDDDNLVTEEPDEDYRTNPDYIRTYNKSVKASMPSSSYYKGGLTPHQYFTRTR